MSNKKQTAVEWLVDRIIQDKNHNDISKKVWEELFEQAKAMEKEQIENAYKIGKIEANMPKEFNVKGEQYYKENYENSKN